MKKENRFTIVRFDVRKFLNISCAEYCFCDMVYALSNSPSAKIKNGGWAYAKRSYYYENIGIGEKGLNKMQKRLIEKGLMIVNPKSRNLLQTTQKWYDASIKGITKTELSSDLEGVKTELSSDSVKPETELSSGQNGTKFGSNTVKTELSSDDKDKHIDKEKIPPIKNGDSELNKIKNEFEEFRKKYKGEKRSFETELKVLKHNFPYEWKKIIFVLNDAIDNQIKYKNHQKMKDGFTPQWKSLKNWLEQRCWEVEIPEIKNEVKKLDYAIAPEIYKQISQAAQKRTA